MAAFASSPWPRGRGSSTSGAVFLDRAAFEGSRSMAGRDNFGCCGLVQGLLGLLQLLLGPRSGRFPAENPCDLRMSSSQVSRTAGSPRDVGISSRSGHPPAPTVGAPRAHPAAGAGRGTSNAHTAPISRRPALTVSAPGPFSATRVQSGTSNSHTAPISRPLALTVSAPRASSATRVQSGTGNGHSAQVTTHRIEPTVSAPRAHPVAGAGRGTSNGHSAIITHPVVPTVSAARPHHVARTGRGTSNTRTSQITQPVEPSVSATRAYPAGRIGRGINNAHTDQITRPVEQTVSVPRVYPAARAGSDSSNAHSGQITYSATATTNGYLPEPDAPEGATVYVRNLPYHFDNETLKLRFQHAGVVLFSKVIYDKETSRSRGFGYVTMSTVQEAEALVRMYHGSVSILPAEKARHLCSSSSQVHLSPVARNSPPQQSDDDDDCVILDSDPHSMVTVTDEKEGSARDGSSDEELQIVAEKGKVACRDFPHSRHLCSNMPFGTTSHEKHCTMCYCFVCDAPAPCSYWGKALSVDDHCHATDKETKWRILREAFRQQSNRSGTSNGHSAQVSHPLALTVSAPRASSASNGHSAQVTHLVDPTVSSPRVRPVAGAGRVTNSGHTALITHPVEPTVSAARPYSAARTGTCTSNTHTSQITRPVEPTVSGTRAYPAGSTGRGISNAHTAQITRPIEQTISAPRVYPAARAGRDLSNAHSAQVTYPANANGEPDAPEGATVYVGNLPYRIDNERLKLSFQHAGVVLFTKVIYNRETGQSCGFGFVTMSTAQEAETAVRMYHGSVMHGRPLAVNITAPRGGARVDTTRCQSGSPLRIFVCNLPAQVDHSQLKELFSKHGKVVDARVIYES